jgi:cytochrome c peroxidase
MKAIGIGGWFAFLAGLVVPAAARGQQPGTTETSYLPVAVTESTRTIRERMGAAKPGVMRRQRALLGDRYDLSDRPAAGVTMSRGKPVQGGIRVKLPAGTTWEALGAMTPGEVRDQDLFPPGFLPLPHPNHPEGGMVFPRFQIDEIKRQEGRNLTRYDLDFDLPDHFLPEFPPPST